MEIFATMPGLPGLFVACAFSGTLRLVCRQAEDGNDGGGSGDDDLTENDNDGDGSSDDKPTGMMTVGHDQLSTELLLSADFACCDAVFLIDHWYHTTCEEESSLTFSPVCR